jgi:hypothetical protein
MTTETIAVWVASLLTSVGAGAFFSWLFKESLGRLLQRSLEKDVERYKSELSAQSAQQLEHLRHEMQKQMLRAQLATTKTHEVYSNLYKKLREVEGRVAGLLGVRFSTDLSTHSSEQIAAYLERLRIPGDERDEVVALYQTDRRTAIEKLDKLARRVEEIEARSAHNDATRYLVEEGIFVSKPVRDLAQKVLTELWSAWVANDMMGRDVVLDRWLEGFRKSTEAAKADLETLENLMRDDLLPASVSRAE